MHVMDLDSDYNQLRFDRTLEMMFGAPTNAGMHVTSNIACAHCQRYTKDSVFRLAQMMLSRNVNSCLLLNQTSFQMVPQTGCRYVNCQYNGNHIFNWYIYVMYLD